MFTKAGDFKVKVVEAILADCKFEDDANAGGFDVCLLVQMPDGESDWWHGAISPHIPQGDWNKEGKNNAQLTMQTLERIGFKGGAEFSRIGELVGVETNATVKSREYQGKTYFEVRNLGGFAPKKIDPNEAARRMKSMMQSASGPASAAPAAAPVTAAPPPQVLPTASVPTGPKPGATLRNPFAPRRP